ADGSVRNAYTVRLLNKQTHYRTVALDVEGLPHAKVQVVGSDAAIEGRPYVAIGPDQTAEMRVLVTVPAHAKLENSPGPPCRIADADVREAAAARDHFIVPGAAGWMRWMPPDP